MRSLMIMARDTSSSIRECRLDEEEREDTTSSDIDANRTD